jgi:hypothetical protein
MPFRRVPRVRIITAAVLATAPVAALIPPVANALGTAHAAAVASCQGSQLVDWLDTTPDGTPGTTYFELRLTNLGSACTLRGYPGVSAVSASGRQLGRPASRVTGVHITTVTVKRGGSVKAAVGLTDTGLIPKVRCHPVTAAGIRVFAPNASIATVIPFPFRVCSANHASSLTVRPVTRSSTWYTGAVRAGSNVQAQL